MNHDGRLDAVATHETGGGGVDVFLNDGAGQLRRAAVHLDGGVAVDSRRRGLQRGYASRCDHGQRTHTAPVHPISLRLLTNDGTGTLTLVPGVLDPVRAAVSTRWTSIGDGDQDLVHPTSATIWMFRRNDGPANFARRRDDHRRHGRMPRVRRLQRRQPHGCGGGRSARPGVAVAPCGRDRRVPAASRPRGRRRCARVRRDPADLNGDGRLDLLDHRGDDNDPAVRVQASCSGDGAGGFGGAVPGRADGFVYFPTLADVNGDGTARPRRAFPASARFDVVARQRRR